MMRDTHTPSTSRFNTLQSPMILTLSRHHTSTLASTYVVMVQLMQHMLTPISNKSSHFSFLTPVIIITISYQIWPSLGIRLSRFGLVWANEFGFLIYQTQPSVRYDLVDLVYCRLIKYVFKVNQSINKVTKLILYIYTIFLYFLKYNLSYTLNTV